MEFEKVDAGMVLVKTTPEELKMLAAAVISCRDFDYALARMDPEEMTALSLRLMNAEQDSWVFHEEEISCLYSIVNMCCGGMSHKTFTLLSPVPYEREELDALFEEIRKVHKLMCEHR